jgi:hypothetical protein
MVLVVWPHKRFKVLAVLTHVNVVTPKELVVAKALANLVTTMLNVLVANVTVVQPEPLDKLVLVVAPIPV